MLSNLSSTTHQKQVARRISPSFFNPFGRWIFFILQIQKTTQPLNAINHNNGFLLSDFFCDID